MSEEIEFTIVTEDYKNTNCQNLLEYIEQQKLDVHYHCRDGFCGACRTKLVDGEIRYHKEPLAFIRKGEFLPCCSYPQSDITIKTKPEKT
ncbi:ferredoxin [Saccharobesus litoralis]|uniref:Ferredoxin n=1 Tax=Saccharobesus litoralis TaxID=2172099 RepID=A0A2S0VP05_9ALTE|nr:class I ribonucleotide reductase maintenance protein YfaE [Saccharobesus litoralis]AWB65946.1 ferredoxin [Saccharobesus litoralis]